MRKSYLYLSLTPLKLLLPGTLLAYLMKFITSNDEISSTTCTVNVVAQSFVKTEELEKIIQVENMVMPDTDNTLLMLSLTS